MSGFTALNVEPEDTFEEEIDDTKEIQIEEAFKLYQNALKLHSQGPSSYEAAEEAYQELFRSEVFKYPEVVTDYGHEQLDDAITLPTPANDQPPLSVLPASAADSAANSLPQLIYLSYKNRGQFILDVARHELSEATPDKKSQCLYYYKYCLRSLGDSASALERDDTDLDLWKRAARISDVLSSQRLVRYCLESVVAGDDETGEQTVDLSGLDEAFASGELLQVLRLIQDDISTAHSSEAQAQDDLLRLLQKSNDPYPFLPQRASQLEYLSESQHPNTFQSRSVIIQLTDQTQIAFATALAQAYGRGDDNESSAAGAYVTISLPSSVEDNLSPIGHDTDAVSTTLEQSIDPQPEKHPSATPAESTHSPASYHSAQDEVKAEVDNNGSEQVPQVEHGRLEATLETETAIQDPDQDAPLDQVPSEMRLPSRKRSSTAAGNEEPESRTKSKRLRARESLMEVTAQEEETAQENDYFIREQFAIIEDSDAALFSYVKNLLSKLDVEGFSHVDVSHSQGEGEAVIEADSFSGARNNLLEDIRHAVKHWTEDTTTAIMSGHGSRDVVEKSGGMSLFQRHLKATLPTESEANDLKDSDATTIPFARFVNRSQSTLTDVSILWLLQILTSTLTPRDLDSSYLRSIWTPEMRENILYVIMKADESLSQQLNQQIQSFYDSSMSGRLVSLAGQEMSVPKVAEMVQTIFELNLDEYYGMSSPTDLIDENARTDQASRMQRWARTATDTMQIYCETHGEDRQQDPLVLRFLLSSALFTGLLAEDDKAHVLSCLGDVRTVLEEAGSPIITLTNNKAMPQVSIAAIDQEISRLSTLDFFNSVFDNENSDPVAIIMKLEPILEPEDVIISSQSGGHTTTNQQNRTAELRSFLDSGDASLRLFLWRRLQNAYTAISYPPKVVSCLLHSLETIVKELQDERHQSSKLHDRQLSMLKWLRDADEIVSKTLSKISDEVTAFESLDETQLQTCLSTISTLLESLYEFVKYDDSIRVGQSSPPTLRTNTAMKSFEKSRDKLRDAFVRAWTLMYYLIKEATVQLSERFDHPADQLAEYLRLVHNVLGPRQYCKQCNKLFIKLAKAELFSSRSEMDHSEDIAQILYDMYQIKLGNGFGDANHGCASDPLGRDKETAFNLVPVIMNYARKLKTKELIKSELKTTIDKIQQTLGQVKGSPALSTNRKAVSGYLKSSINPQEVYRSLKGIGDLLTKPVSGEYAKIAAQGWYHMLGSMSLAKYKSVKRVNPTPTDELDTAATFLKLDLEYSIGNWESWYRLAQVFDAKIEDNLIWNSLKINDSRVEIALLERNAINAYTMAIVMAMRNADDTVDTVQKISDMFSEFAVRLYASSRPPLSMEAFNTDKHMRHLSSNQDQSMSKAPFVFPFKPYTVWAFAAYLLQRRFATGQKEWLCYYTLGKCFWKMFQNPENEKAKRRVTKEDVLEAFVDAVEMVPSKEKSTDYILEPHYKLVSVVHKMVNRKLLSPSQGVQYLQATQFARTVHWNQDDQESDWDSYILDILRKLGHADKSNWHHRITARAAHVNYDDDPSIAGALGAKHQFTQQIFTKTMTMQVWKPEYERPGRHYVYTGRYLSFFVHLLDLLNDRASLEQLVRRIRRKTTDFLDHPRIWEETASTYVKLLRRVGKIPEGHERNTFDKISFDDFSKMSEKVEKWAHDPENSSAHQDIMQDAIELKKLNNSLMKGPAIDDLIGDAYACMYEAFVAQLPPEEVIAPTATTLPQGTFINMSTDVIPTGDDNLDRMRLNNLLSAQTDGMTSGGGPDGPVPGLGAGTPRANTPLVEPVRIPTPSKPGRTKTITRREVQRKAEACVVKQPPPIKTPTMTKRPLIDLSNRRDSSASNLQDGVDGNRSNADENQPDSSRVSSRHPSMSPEASAEPDEADQDADGEGGDENDGEADDESELSELENDEEDGTSKPDRTAGKVGSESNARKRKAENEDEDEGGSGEEDQGDEGEEEDEEEANDEHETNETADEQGKDEMDVDEAEEQVMEVQDSQELKAPQTPESVKEVPARKRRVSSRGGNKKT